MRIVVHDYGGHPFAFDLSRELARRGHPVWHLYFAGDKGPKGSAQPDDPATLTVLPVSIEADYDKGDFIGRFVNDGAYGRAVGVAIREIGPDVVISGNTPPDAQAAILAAARKGGVAFISWVQDLYGVAIRRIVGSKNALVGFAAGTRYQRLEEQILTSSDAIVVISPGFRDHIPARIAATRPFHVIQNWGSIGAIPQRPKDNPWSRRHRLQDRFVFLYSGTLGLKHDPHLLLALADDFMDDPEVQIVVAASGLGRDQLGEALAARPRANLTLLPLQPIADFPDALGTADVVVAVLEADAAAYSAPSKVLSYLCAGKPILLSAPADNLASRVVIEAGAGTVIEAGRTDAFLAEARCLRTEDGRRAGMGRAGRAYAEQTFDPAQVADRFQAVFHDALARRRPKAG